MVGIRFKQLVATSACALAGAVCMSSCETYPKDKATAIVTAPYPGKNVPDACKPYADALCKALAANHIPAWSVYYLRNNMSGPQGHAMVVYQDAGAYWCADNAFAYPTKCSGTTPMEWAQDHEAMWLGNGGDVNAPAGFSSSNVIVSAFAVSGNNLLAAEKHGAKPGSPRVVSQKNKGEGKLGDFIIAGESSPGTMGSR